jgi:hypothetical protein
VCGASFASLETELLRYEDLFLVKMEATGAPPFDLEASPVQGQLASAVLDLNGNLVRGQLSPHDASLLFQMLAEVGSLGVENFRRLTVTFSSARYVVSRDENHVYMVQTRAGN